MSNSILVLGTGAIAEATAQTARQAGYDIHTVARSATAPDWSSEHHQADLADFAAMQALADTYQATPPAGMLATAGAITLAPVERLTEQSWQDCLQANLTTALLAVQLASRTQSKTGGTLVLMSSAAANLGLPNHEAVAAAKAGVIGLGQAAAASLSKKRIRVNVVAPGLTHTQLAEKALGEPGIKASTAWHPLGRVGQPADVARAIWAVLDPEQTWQSGSVITVDGGLSTMKLR
jgi:NAD(P)-dependent dehydrogenase (short-subunit alcohol dehydrogenase family)